MKYIYFLLLSIWLFPQTTAQKIINCGQGKNILSNEIIIKLKDCNQQHGLPDALPAKLLKALEPLSPISFKYLFPTSSMKSASLNGIIEIIYAKEIDPRMFIQKISNNSDIEWAEPRFIYETSHIPNDPSLGNQWYINKINSYSAWDITKGDTSIVIGIVDTGIDWDHPDLAGNIKRNWNEIPNNNIDDDHNGYVDDYIGWDFGGLSGTPDNNPMEDRPDHGTHVAGIASAVTNNGIGIAGIGYKSKLMAVKTSQDNYRSILGSPYIVFGFEGIVYAVNNGCKIINCSWGGYNYSALGQDVIRYATTNGALIVAAAGNDNTADLHYPSSYDGVISVGATTEGDLKSSFSNYGTAIDVSAPGESMYSTWMNDTYLYNSGTSMASPLAAGTAALIAARFPNYTSMQIGEQLRATCDNIDNSNPQYAGLIGRGRINAYNAVNNSNTISVRAYNISFIDANNDGVIQPGEDVAVYVKFRNYLNPITSMTIGMESKSPYASILAGGFNAPSAAMLDSFTNYSTPFIFRVSSSIPANTVLQFSINYVITPFVDHQIIEVIANPTYAAQSGNDISMTVTSKGTYGYNDYPNNLQGNGFRYQLGSSILFEGALITGTSVSKLSNSARNANQGNAQDNDFVTVKPFQLFIPGSAADVEGASAFNDNNAGANSIGITTQLNTYSYSSPADMNYIIARYRFKNNNAAAVSNFYAGIFSDWDLTSSGNDDMTLYDTLGRLGYCYHVGANPMVYTGIVILNDHIPGYWGILNAGGDNGFSIYDGFSDDEKWRTISNGIGKASAGAGDISFVLSDGPYVINANQTVETAFAFVAGNTLEQLRQTAERARLKYRIILTSIDDKNISNKYSFHLYQNYPNPFNPSTQISYSLDQTAFVSLKVYDVLGNEIQVLSNKVEGAGEHTVSFDAENLQSGIYFVRLQAGERQQTIKIILLR